MKSMVPYGGYAALALSIVLVSSRSAVSGGQATSLVRLQTVTPGVAQTGHLNISGTAIAGQFQGGGSGIVNLSAANIANGVLPDARLSANVPLLATDNAFTGINTFGNYLLVGRTTRVTNAESFGVGNSAAGFDGMYVRTAATGSPFYGYSLNGLASAYHYVDGGDGGKWKLYNGGVRLTVEPAGNVGIGTASPTAKLEVTGPGAYGVRASSLLGSGTAYGGYFSSASSSGYGVFGTTNGIAGVCGEVSVDGSNGVIGRNTSASGSGVYGVTLSGSGPTIGGWFESLSSQGTGVRAVSLGTYGVRAQTNLGSGVTYGGHFTSFSSSGYGVFGTTNGIAGVCGEVSVDGSNGVMGRNTSATGSGVYGVTTFGSGPTIGGWFESMSSSGTGVRADSAGTYGVRARSTIGTGVTYGGHFTSFSSSGYGVFGTTNGIAGVCGEVSVDGSNGVMGRNTSATGSGVYGVTTFGSGPTIGGWFESMSSSGTGVRADSAGTYGLRAKSSLGTGITYGVYGEAVSALGFGGYFVGRGHFSGNVGIGTTSPSELLEIRGGSGPTSLLIAPGKYFGANTANSAQFDIPGTGNVLFWDNVHVNNTLTAGAKNFRIDHPLNPDNQYLQHGCVESDEYRNLYDGEVTTDAKGEAVVTMPRWFEALNTKIRYQLTIVDEESDEFVQVKVSRRLRDGVFTIKSSHPHVTVCWLLTGIRKDSYAIENPLVVEMDKPDTLRGRLIHP